MIEILDWFAAHDEFAVLLGIFILVPIYWFTRALAQRRKS